MPARPGRPRHEVADVLADGAGVAVPEGAGVVGSMVGCGVTVCRGVAGGWGDAVADRDGDAVRVRGGEGVGEGFGAGEELSCEVPPLAPAAAGGGGLTHR